MAKTNKSKWNKSHKAVKANQIAFELEQKIAQQIHKISAKEGLTPSNQIRKIIGLSFSPPKRPRLTISLSPEDYKELGEKYKVDPEDTFEIKRHIMEELIHKFK